MNSPDGNDLQRFFAPECDFSFGKLVAADVENSRADLTRRARENMAVWEEGRRR